MHTEWRPPGDVKLAGLALTGVAISIAVVLVIYLVTGWGLGWWAVTGIFIGVAMGAWFFFSNRHLRRQQETAIDREPGP